MAVIFTQIGKMTQDYLALKDEQQELQTHVQACTDLVNAIYTRYQDNSAASDPMAARIRSQCRNCLNVTEKLSASLREAWNDMEQILHQIEDVQV